MTVPCSNPVDIAIQRLLHASSREEARELVIRASPPLTSLEVHRKLTEMIADRRCKSDLWSMASLIACRGLLGRCQSQGVDKALAAQPGWPLINHGSLTRLLTLPPNLPPEIRIAQANAALDDVEPDSEQDIVGLIHYNLGLGYQVQADAGSHDAMARAMAHFETAVQAWKEELLFGSEFLGRAQDNLGRLYWKRRHGNRSRDIEMALRWFNKAQEAFGEESPDRLHVYILIGDACLDRIEGERLDNIERGIEYYREAHRLATQQNDVSRLGEIEHNLAIAYRVRLAGHPAHNYEQARAWAEQALGRFDRGKSPEACARTLAELATIYGHRQEGDRNTNLETAIKYAQQALEVYHPDTHPQQWTLVQLTLGNLYCDRVSGVQSENEDRAIACFQEILDRCDPESDPLRWSEAMNNLGTVYASRSSRLNDANYRRATGCYREALEVRTPQTLPAKTLQTATNWGNLDFWFGRWAKASESFQMALKAGQALYQASITEAGRKVELAETWQLVARAAYCWLRMGQPDQALLQLEGGKARMLAEALALGDSDLDVLPDTQQKAMLGARRAIREFEAEMRLPQDAPGRRGDRDLARELKRARTDLDQLVEAIRAEYRDFMPIGLDLPGMLAQIPEGGALVAPLVTAQGSAAFVLPSGTQGVTDDHAIPLDAFSDGDLDALLVGTQQDPGWLRAYVTWREGGPLREWKRAVETLTARLWEVLIGPIHQRLRELGLAEGAPVTLMPQGGLGLLPLHAAWRGVNGAKRAFLDDYTLSYAPSAYTLSVSRRRLQDERRHQPQLLAMVNPTHDLLYAPMEGRAVAEAFPPAARLTLVEDEATREALLREAPGCTYLHFACHGSYGWQDVMRSALVLAGRHGFTLSEILAELDLDVARLVTLSACETGLTEFQGSPDEYIGLPAGFLQAGVPEVVSSLWAVDDLSTALLMARFYHHHVREGLGTGQALRAAQRWLRGQVDRPMVVEYIQSLLAELEAQHAKLPSFSEAAYALGRRIHRLQQQCEAWLKEEQLDPGGRPFDHPYYWAAFTLWGPNLDAKQVESL